MFSRFPGDRHNRGRLPQGQIAPPEPAVITAPSASTTIYQGNNAVSLEATMPSDNQATTQVEWQIFGPIAAGGASDWRTIGTVSSAPWTLSWNTRTAMHNPFLGGSRTLRVLRTTVYGTTASETVAITLWNPRLITGVLGWWTPRFTTAAGGYQSWVSPGGASVSETKQLIGSDDTANRLTQASAGSMPQLATGLNGWNKLTLNGTSHYLENLSLSWGTVDDFSLIAIMKQDVAGAGNPFPWLVGVDDAASVGQITNGGTNHAINSGGTSVTGSTPNTSVKLVAGIFDKDGNDELWIDGSSVTTGDSGSNSHNGTLRWGSNRFATPDAWFDGDAYDAIMVGQILSAGDKTHLAAWQTANGLQGS